MFKRPDYSADTSERMIKPTFATEFERLEKLKEGFDHLGESSIISGIRDTIDLYFPELKLAEEGIDVLDSINSKLNSTGVADTTKQPKTFQDNLHRTVNPWDRVLWANLPIQRALPGSVAMHHQGATIYEHSGQDHISAE